ncbi:MAG: YcaO-like family protein [Colwellia sp.]|nr:YcaO-like family protein [Colwellia sp.]
MALFEQYGNAQKGYFEGTHRTRSPEDTFAAYGPLMPKMGITRLANVTGLDRIGLPVYVSIRPNGRSLSTSQGKGETLAHAKVSALMESIETWHAEHISLPCRYEPYTTLTKETNVIDVDRLSVRNDSTYHKQRAISWLEGVDLFSHQPCWVPYDTVSTNFVQQPGLHPIFTASTNGLSSGNHQLEATIHGICEVIERDAVTMWTLVNEQERKSRQVDVSTIDHPHLNGIIAKLKEKGLVLAVWDITSDVGIPIYTCSIIEDPSSPEWRPIPAFPGHGCHLQPEIALSRAIHEAIQGRLTAISGSRDDMFPSDYVEVGNKDDHRQIISMLNDVPATREFAPIRLPVADNFYDDLNTILERLKTIGVETAVAVDLTKSDLGIPVVKVVVPHLEPFHTIYYRRGPRALNYRRSLGL